jgi:hypothetical protein
MKVTPALFFFIAAFILFVIEAWRSESILAAGLACLTVALFFTL